MFIGLEDFDIDIFLRLDDENIDIYYTDFETLPQLANIVPLGSFDSDGKLKLIKLPMEDRIKIGIEFFHRDGFGKVDRTLYFGLGIGRIDRNPVLHRHAGLGSNEAHQGNQTVFDHLSHFGLLCFP